MNGNGSLITPASLAAERRSQPQQIADLRVQLLELQGRHSMLVQQAADDSRKLHALTNDHEAALLHFKQAIDEHYAEWSKDSLRLWAVLNEHDQAYQARPLSFMARLRWLMTGR